MTTPRALRLDGVEKHYGKQAAVAGVDLDVPAGAYVVLLGPSGSGKTTLLSILGGFTVPSAGRVLLGDEDVTAVPPARRPTATVVPGLRAVPHLSVAGNVGFGLSVRKVQAAERTAKVAAALAMVGLQGYETRAISALSAASASAWRSPGRWWWNPPSCSSTNRSARSTCISAARCRTN